MPSQTCVVYFVDTEKNKDLQKALLEKIKNYIHTVEQYKNYKIESMKKSIKILGKNYFFSFNIGPYFAFFVFFEPKADLKELNRIFNDSIEKIYEKHENELPQAMLFYEIKAETKNLTIFQKLTNNAWREYLNDKYQVRRLELWETPENNLRQGFFIQQLKGRIGIQAIRSNFFDKIPKDILLAFGSESIKELENFIKKLE